MNIENDKPLRLYRPEKREADRTLEDIANRIEKHLQNELGFIDELACLCQQLNALLRSKSLDKLTDQDFQTLESWTKQCNSQQPTLQETRKQLLEEIQRYSTTDGAMTLRKFIALLPEPRRSQLEAHRWEVLNKSKNMRSVMCGSQAVIYYSFDFWRRMLEGLMQCDSSSTQYDAGGRTGTIPAGNLLRKTC